MKNNKKSLQPLLDQIDQPSPPNPLSHRRGGIIANKLTKLISILTFITTLTTNNILFAQPNPLAPTPAKNTQFPSLKVTVNSNEDGEVIPDEKLTLREAILIVNGSLPLSKLSNEEKNQVQELSGKESQIIFNLPSDKIQIKLKTILPPLASPGLILDGTSQPGYDSKKSATSQIFIPIPVVEITPLDDVEILRGLTVIADKVTIKGLSIYGFNAKFDRTLTTPPADIFVSHRLPPPYTTDQQKFTQNSPYSEQDLPPKDVQIENNWLGIKPNEEMPENNSAFGVYVFNGIHTNIYRNRIYYHEGSGIITSVNANNMQVIENIIVANGMAGMPDAIRLEGIISDSLIKSNLICGNDGAGIYLFKPIGATTISNNYIKFNSRSLRRSAVYLMGNDHKVIDNEITNQVGAGVTVAAYPESIRNIITGNKFNALDGLSIDLTTTNNVGVQDFQYGDGINPPRNSSNRKLDTGNAAINSPEFMSTDFYLLGNKVNIDGKADPNSQIDLYRVTNIGLPNYGGLYEYIGTTKTNEKGKFGISLNNVKIGAKISAIATLPEYGTSEPASIATVRSLDKSANTEELAIITELPECTTPPPIVQVPPPEIPPEKPPEMPPEKPPESPPEIPPTKPPEIPPEIPPKNPPILRIKIERNVHFALDKYNISKGSAKVLDRVVEVLKKYPNLIIELHGHTDYRANNDYNQRLGMNRAKSVRNYLLKKGISPSRMTIKSFGEEELKKPGSEKLDHARNRRVEIIFKDYQGMPLEVEDQESDLQLEKSLKIEN